MADDILLDCTRARIEQAVADQVRNGSPVGVPLVRSLIDSNAYPELASIIGNPAALKALNEMGLPNTKFWKAVIISKPPRGPRLYWH